MQDTDKNVAWRLQRTFLLRYTFPIDIPSKPTWLKFKYWWYNSKYTSVSVNCCSQYSVDKCIYVMRQAEENSWILNLTVERLNVE